MSHDLELVAILDRSEDAYDYVKDQPHLAQVVRQHFNHDVPALIGAVKRLTVELDQALDAHGRTVDGVMAAGWERVASELGAVVVPDGVTFADGTSIGVVFVPNDQAGGTTRG
jgi:hypothetical protein